MIFSDTEVARSIEFPCWGGGPATMQGLGRLHHFHLLITGGKNVTCSIAFFALLFTHLCCQSDARRLMTTTEADAIPAPDSGDTFAFPPFSLPDNPSTGSASPPAPLYCIYPPVITFPPYSEAPPPPPFYFTPVIPINPPPTTIPNPPATIPSPPQIVPNPPTVYMPNPPGTIPSPPPAYVPSPPQTVPSPPAGYVPNPPATIPSPPSSSFPPVFQPPVLYPPPSAPPPPPGGSVGIWCVAKPSVPEPIIQEAMNYACGSGADCQSIQNPGPCFSPNTLLNHASFAFNSYWQRTKAAGGTCDFGGTAMIVTTDPSYDGCHFLYNRDSK